MSLKDELLKKIKPIASSYTSPKGVLAGIASLMGSPLAGAAIRYGPAIADKVGSVIGPTSGEGTKPFGGMSGMTPLGLAKPRAGVGGGSDLQLSNLAQYLQRQRGREGVPQMNQGGLVQQVIADRQRVLDSFTPNPYDQYQYLMQNPATRQAPPDVTTMPVDPTPADPNAGRLSFDDFKTQEPTESTMSPLEARIAELMGSRGMTQEEAAANQAFAAQQGADLNNDGAVTNAEYAQYLASREPTTATGVPAMPNPMGGGFLSSILNSDGLQRAIDEYRASMAEQSGDMDMTPATPAVPEDLQDRIRALMSGSGMMGGMIPNIDVGRLRQIMADLYGGQTEQIRPVAMESTRPAQMMVDPRRMRGLL